MKKFVTLFMVFIFFVRKCSLDSGNKFLRDIYEYDVPEQDSLLSSTNKPANRFSENDENYEDDYDLLWFPAQEVTVGTQNRHMGGLRNRFRKRKLNKKRRRIPRIRGLNRHFPNENNKILPNSGRLYNHPNFVAEEDKQDKEGNKWKYDEAVVGSDKTFAARLSKSKLNPEKGRMDRCEEGEKCKDKDQAKDNRDNFLNVSYIFIPVHKELAEAKESKANSSDVVVEVKHHSDESLEKDLKGNGSEKVISVAYNLNKNDGKLDTEKNSEHSPHVLVVNRVFNCEILKPNTSIPNDEGKKEESIPDDSHSSSNTTNKDENRKPPDHGKHEDSNGENGGTKTTNHEEHKCMEEKDKTTVKPKKCEDEDAPVNKTTEEECGFLEELHKGHGFSNMEYPGKNSQVLLINKFLKSVVTKPKNGDNNEEGGTNALTGEEMWGPISSKENADPMGAMVRDEGRYSCRGNDMPLEANADEYPIEHLAEEGETKPKSENVENDNNRQFQSNNQKLQKDREKTMESQYENMKFQLGNEVFNCTAVRLGNFLATPKHNQDLRPESVNLEKVPHENSALGANQTSGLNLNITINGVVLSSNKEKKLYGNGTIRLLPEHKKKRERYERGIKIPFMKKLVNTGEDMEQLTDDERDEQLRDDKERPMCRPKNKTKTCNVTPRPCRPEKNQQQNNIGEAAAEAGISSMKLSNEIVKMVSQMVHSNPKMSTLWPSLANNKPFMQKNTQTPLRNSAKCSERKHVEDMLRRAMASVNEIIEQEIQTRSCVPLSDDLAEFYQKILSTHAKQAKRKEEREEMLNKAETLDDSGGEDTKQKHREGKRSKGSDDPNEDFQDNGLFDMIHSRKVEYEREVQEDRQRREANRRMNKALNEENNSSLISQLRELYTPAFLKLNSAAESFERADIV